MGDNKISLKEAPIGVPLKVVEFDCGREAQCRLIGLGIIPGSRLIITNKFSSDGPFSVIVNGTKVVVGRGLLTRIFVVPDEEVSFRIGIVGFQGAGKRNLLERLCKGVKEAYREDYLSPVLKGEVIWKGKRIEVEVLPSILGEFPLSVRDEVGFALALEGAYDELVVLAREETLEKDLLLLQYLVEFSKRVVLAVNTPVEDVDLKVVEELTGVRVVRVSVERGYGFEGLLEIERNEVRGGDLTPQVEECVEDWIRRMISWIAEEHCSVIYPLSAVVLKVLEVPKDVEFFFKREDARKRLLAMIDEANKHCEWVLGEQIGRHVFERRYALVRGILESGREEKRSAFDWTRVRDVMILTGGLYVLFLTLTSLVRYPILLLVDFLKDCPIQSWSYFLGIVGLLLVFLPAIFLFFVFFFSLYETNYIYRFAFEVDRFLHGFGFHGGVLLPMVANVGCSIPAIDMANRNLSGKDRISVLLSLPFGNCMGSFLVFSIICSLLFSPAVAGLAMMVLVLASLLYTLLVAGFIRMTIGGRVLSPSRPMQFPDVRSVPMGVIVSHAFKATLVYLRKVFVVILPVAFVIWFLFRYGMANLSFSFWSWVGRPIGLDGNQVLSLLMGLIAKELVVVSQFVFSGIRGYDPSSWANLGLILFLYPACLPVYFTLARIVGKRLAWGSFVIGLFLVYFLVALGRYLWTLG